MHTRTAHGDSHAARPRANDDYGTRRSGLLSPPGADERAWRVLRQPNFRRYAAGRLSVATAMTLLRATIAWQIYELTGSPFHLALMGLVQFLPALSLSLVGGAVADSFDRRLVSMLAQSAALAGAAGLLVLSATGATNLFLLYLLVFAIAAAASFEAPARAALLPLVVSREEFPRAVAATSAVTTLGFMTGPMVSGFAIDAGGPAAAYALGVVLTALSIAALAVVHTRPPEGARQAVTLGAIIDGLRFVRRRQVVLGCMTLDMFAVIFGGATALLPVYAKDILHVGPRGYGVLSMSMEVGAVLMSLLLLAVPTIRRTGRALLVAVIVYAVATIVFGLSRTYALSVVAYMMAGMADYISVVMRSTAIQLATPDELRGRVSSINMIFIGASNQLGAVESGVVAGFTSAPFAVVSGGVGALIVAAVVAITLPELRRYSAFEPRRH